MTRRFMVLVMGLCLGGPAAAQVFNKDAVDMCLEALPGSASAAPCMLMVRGFCLESSEDVGLAAEIACLDRALLAFDGWTDQTVADHEALAPIVPQITDYRSQLFDYCAAQIVGDSQEDRRDFRLCQLAGSGAMYRNISRGAALAAKEAEDE
ncbi:MAG: hypothetical protein AAF667_09630 [Pseudomonadota bacterium]